MADKNETPGTLLRGPDGHLYFVPHSKLAPFRVPDKGTKQMTEKLLEGTTAAHTSIPNEWVNLGLCILHNGGASG